MQSLVCIDFLDERAFPEWVAIIGLRNRIVHEYMNLDMGLVLKLVRGRDYRQVVDFLLAPVELR